MQTLKIRRDENGHITYLKYCEFCSTEYKGRKINSRFCSNSCRNLKLKAERKNQTVN